jgi:hypothetical protein
MIKGTQASLARLRRSLERFTENIGPGLAVYVFAELLDPDVGDISSARHSAVLRRVAGRGPASRSPALLGPYHISWGT